MIVELFGAPGSGKTFLIKQFLDSYSKTQTLLTRQDFSTWLRTKDRLFKLRCIFRNLPFSICYLLLLVFSRLTVQRPNVTILWIPKAVLNEVLLREFSSLNSESVILLDQGSLQRIVSYIIFSSRHRPALAQFILNFIFQFLSKYKIHLFINTENSISTNRVFYRKKDPSISRFDSIDCKDSLLKKISEANLLFSSLALSFDPKSEKIYIFKNNQNNISNTIAFDDLISAILK